MLTDCLLFTYSYTFKDPGTYLYFCKYHSAVENGNIAGMVGEVIVQPAYAPSSDLQNVTSLINSVSGQVSSQIGMATSIATAGVVLGIIGIIIAVVTAVWAARKTKKTAS